MTPEDRWLQQQLDNPRSKISIISGEGEGYGTENDFSGKRTIRSLRMAIKRETCGGDRWAYGYLVTTDGGKYRIGRNDIEQVE